MTELERENKWWEREDFIEYLEETLIPDLYDSGMEETAKDFRVAVKFMRNPQLDEVEME